MHDGQSQKLWGGRFAEAPDRGFAAFNESFSFDRRLFEADIRGSIAHCEGLVGASALTAAEGEQIKTGLARILESGQTDPKYFEVPAEDVHSFVEARLVETIGDVGRKLHTGRSRNDQVATDLRLWLRQSIDDLVER